jgi:hypothetical protein
MAPASKEELEAERQCWEHRRDVEELSAQVLVLGAKIQAAHDRIDEIGRQRTEERAKAEAIASERKSSTQTRMWIAASIALPILLKLAELLWSNAK